jgi:hypothetical protein
MNSIVQILDFIPLTHESVNLTFLSIIRQIINNNKKIFHSQGATLIQKNQYGLYLLS